MEEVDHQARMVLCLVLAPSVQGDVHEAFPSVNAQKYTEDAFTDSLKGREREKEVHEERERVREKTNSWRERDLRQKSKN